MLFFKRWRAVENTHRRIRIGVGVGGGALIFGIRFSVMSNWFALGNTQSSWPYKERKKQESGLDWPKWPVSNILGLRPTLQNFCA